VEKLTLRLLDVGKKNRKEIMNTNPSLAIGLAMEAVKKSGTEVRLGDESQSELRVYPNNGSGYFFVEACLPGRWLWRPEVGASYNNRLRPSDMKQLEDAIAAGARVQLTGYHGKSLALWRTWDEFEKAVN